MAVLEQVNKLDKHEKFGTLFIKNQDKGGAKKD